MVIEAKGHMRGGGGGDDVQLGIECGGHVWLNMFRKQAAACTLELVK